MTTTIDSERGEATVRNAGKASAWLALAIVLSLYFVIQVLPLLRHSSQNDFKHIWLGSLMLSEGLNPYDVGAVEELRSSMAREDARFSGILPFVYLPFTGIVLRPLAALPFSKAAIAWQLINHAFIIGALVLLARATRMAFNWRTVTLMGAFTVFNFCVTRQNTAGQLNAVLLFGAALLWLGIVRGWHDAALGFIAAFLMLFKLTPGIFLIWFLLTRRWRAAAWMCGFAVVMMLLCIAIAGWRTHLDFLPILRDMGYGRSTWGQTFWRDAANQSPNAFFHHVLVEWPGGAKPWFNAGSVAANAFTWLLSFSILAFFAWACWKVPAGLGPVPSDLDATTYSLAILASLLVPSIMWDHYLTQAIVPAVLLWGVASGQSCSVSRIGICVAVLLWSLSLVFDSQFLGLWPLPVGVPVKMEGGLRWLLMSLKLWPTLALFGLGVCLATRMPPGGRQETFAPQAPKP